MSKPLFKRVFVDYRMRWLMYILTVLLYVAMLIGFYPSVQENVDQFSDLLSSYPDGLIEAFGITEESFSSIEGYISVEFLSVIWILILSFLIFSLGSSIIAGEVDTGTSEFTYSLPFSRSSAVLSEFLASFLLILSVIIITMLSIFFGSILVDEQISLKSIIVFSGVSASAGLFLLGIATFFSSLFSTRGRVFSACGGFFLVSYLLHILKGIGDSVDWLYHLSFFKYYGNPQEILMLGSANVNHTAVLLIAGFVFLLFSFYRVEKRDL